MISLHPVVSTTKRVSRLWEKFTFASGRSRTSRCPRGAPGERMRVPQLAVPRIMIRLLMVLTSFVLAAQALSYTEGESRVHQLVSMSSFRVSPSSAFASYKATDRCILFPERYPHPRLNRQRQAHRRVEPPPTKPATITTIIDNHNEQSSRERVLERGHGGANVDTGSVDLGVPRSAAVKAYLERKRAAQRAMRGPRRDFCTRCSRPQKVCLCSVLPTEAIATSTRFIILQHPTESKRQVTGTVPLVLLCLSNCRRIIMPHNEDGQYDDGSLRKLLGITNSRTESGDDSPARVKPLLLFPCPKAEFLEDIAFERCEQAAAAEAPAAASRDRPPVVGGEQQPGGPLLSLSSPPAVVVIIDGTWSQARQILSRYPSLSPRRPSAVGPGARGVRSPVEFSAASERDRELDEEPEETLCRAVMFRSAGPSGYGFRREPSRECISTLESVAYSLEVLEQTPEGLSAVGYLRRAFSAMVSIQLEARSCPSSPRFEKRYSKDRAQRSSTDASSRSARR